MKHSNETKLSNNFLSKKIIKSCDFLEKNRNSASNIYLQQVIEHYVGNTNSPHARYNMNFISKRCHLEGARWVHGIFSKFFPGV